MNPLRTVRLGVELAARKSALTGHTDPVQAVALSPDGTTIAAAGQDTTVRV